MAPKKQIFLCCIGLLLAHSTTARRIWRPSGIDYEAPAQRPTTTDPWHTETAESVDKRVDEVSGWLRYHYPWSAVSSVLYRQHSSQTLRPIDKSSSQQSGLALTTFPHPSFIPVAVADIPNPLSDQAFPTLPAAQPVATTTSSSATPTDSTPLETRDIVAREPRGTGVKTVFVTKTLLLPAVMTAPPENPPRPESWWPRSESESVPAPQPLYHNHYGQSPFAEDPLLTKVIYSPGSGIDAGTCWADSKLKGAPSVSEQAITRGVIEYCQNKAYTPGNDTHIEVPKPTDIAWQLHHVQGWNTVTVKNEAVCSEDLVRVGVRLTPDPWNMQRSLTSTTITRDQCKSMVFTSLKHCSRNEQGSHNPSALFWHGSVPILVEADAYTGPLPPRRYFETDCEKIPQSIYNALPEPRPPLSVFNVPGDVVSKICEHNKKEWP